MSVTAFSEEPDSNKVYHDTVFMKANKHISDHWVRIGELYPEGVNKPLLPAEFTREHFGQGNHSECFMLTALSTLVRFPDVIQNCFVSKNVRRDGRYTFRFFRGKKWVSVEIDDSIPLEDGEVLYMRSPTKHWWPLLLEKAYAKFYTGYENLEGCTLQEVYHDLTGNPVLSIPMDAKLAKAAGVDVMEGRYWLDLAQRIQSGQVVASVLTNGMDLENMGLQREQQYGILEIFSLTGTSSVSDIVIHLHNPFEDEEFRYTGPLNSKDPQWTPKLRTRYAVDDARSAFVPLQIFHNITNSMQLCYMSSIESEATYFDDEWKGETAGGNPTCVTWRKNPLYTVRNASSKDLRFLVMIKQEDKRSSFTGENEICYNVCGVALAQCTSAHCIPSFFVTGNNHKHVFKSLFLEAREVTNIVTVPARSLCYLVPFCTKCGVEGKFTLAFYKIAGEAFTQLSIEKLRVPEMDWAHPAEEFLEIKMNEKDRVDFYVDAETDIHILLHQDPRSKSAAGNNAVTENYIGMYLYDDTDKKIGGVTAASNLRESSILHHLPRSGRYAISVTCPRAKDQVSICIKIIGSSPANARIVDAPPDACMFDDDDIIEGGDAPFASNPINDTPINFTSPMPTEVPDTTIPFEDKRFMIDNRSITNDPWIHIGDLYPEGKTQPLLPDRLSCDQFEQGEHFECCCLKAFATLVDHHPDVIRNLFVTKNVRKDCRYTFQFHRYGQWVKVEIDDRIPMTGKNILYCRSPSRHWWPLLLEKAYAKFYTIYDNLERCGLQELFYDFTGLPVISIPTNTKLARSISYDIDEPQFWLGLNQNLNTTALGALTGPMNSDTLGLISGQSYGIIGVFALKESKDITLSDLVVKIYNPYRDSVYTGPMNRDDHKWTSEHRLKFAPERPDVMYMPVDVFCDVFESVQQAYLKGLQEPSWHFNSEWGEGTNGGNPGLVTWRENPLYVVRNTSDKPIGIVGLICQPDQRHMLHKLPANDMVYHSAVLVLAEKKQKDDIPTFLVTFNNHRIIFKGLFSNCREVASFMVVPPKSLCYLVPSCMGQEKSKFLLSYWLTNRVADQCLAIVQYKPNVSRSLSAIKHLELHNKEQDRVDFLVDVPTDIHILLRQEKPFTSPGGDDIIAEDFVGMYLYDENNKRIGGVLTATNYREMGIVQRLPSAGRYALSITCPRGNGTVPVKVEIVGVERARVRITEPPEDSGDLMEVDLGFLDEYPQGVPLSDLPVDKDDVFQSVLANLKELCKDPEKNEACIAEDKRRLNERANALAKQFVGEDRATYLAGHALKTLKPLLDADKNYMNKELQRYTLKNDPRNATKVKNIEDELRKMADAIAEHEKNSRLDFIGTRPEGIPIADLPLKDDHVFLALANERFQLKCNPVANAKELEELEARVNARVHELAKEMHVRERNYLDPEPEGLPLELLSLNDDAAFSKMEDDLRALNREIRKDPKAITNLENKLNDRAHELTVELVKTERDLFLDPKPEGVPIADVLHPADDIFRSTEVERLRLRKEDPRANAEAIKNLEKKMNDRAAELARKKLEGELAFLEKAPYGISMNELGLVCDDEVKRKTIELMDLRKDPKKNAEAIKALEDKLMSIERDVARGMAALDRKFLEPKPEGCLLTDLPLDDDKTFVDMDTKRRLMIRSGAAPKKVQALEEEMNDRVHEIARSLNAKERPDYLKPAPLGVPLENLPLDLDEKFRELEATRQQLKRDLNPNMDAIADVEAALNARSEELAAKKLSDDRGYLDPEPEGVPLRLLALGTDGPFMALESKRAQLKTNPLHNAKTIRDLESDLNDRARDLANELKQAERATFLNPKPLGIPIDIVPIDDDDVFRSMEIKRLLLGEDLALNADAMQELEDAMNERAAELAGKLLAAERAFLDPEPLGLPLEELPLNDNQEFRRKEDELRELRKNKALNAPAILDLERVLKNFVMLIAADEFAKDRDFLDREPEGRLLEDLPLCEDKEFNAMERDRRQSKKDPAKNSEKIAYLEKCMNARAHKIAKTKNAVERIKYLDPKPRGVPIEDLPLDTDDEFAKVEERRIKLMRNPSKNLQAIQGLEDALNLRAEELAKERLQSERGFLDPEPHGIPLKYLPLNEDPEFHEKEVQRMALKAQNLPLDGSKLKELENDMNGRVNELASHLKERQRAKVLDAVSNGVPVNLLLLDDDTKFNEIELSYIKVLLDGEDPAKARTLSDAMRKRAAELATRVKADNRLKLEQNPIGIPLDELPLDKTDYFLQKEAEVLSLMKDSKRNAAAILNGMDVLNAMVYEMAKERVQKEREILDPEPEGCILTELPLNSDPTFLGFERRYRELKKDPNSDKGSISDLERMMNDHVHKLAKKMNADERINFLDKNVRGVPLSDLPLDSDEEFARLESERAYLRHDTKKNAARIAKVEEAMQRLVDEMAADALRQDRIFLGDAIERVLVCHLALDEDADFCSLESKRARLKSEDPRRHARAIEDIEKQMRNRAVDLASALKDEVRTEVVQCPLGVPLKYLSLDDDRHFNDLENRYLELCKDSANRGKAEEILSQLNDRAREIAQHVHDTERASLVQAPEGIPLFTLPLNEDERFNALETEARDLRMSGRSDPRARELKDAMNQRAAELARAQRKTYCDERPEGIPLEILKLGYSDEFTRMEEELRSLKREPEINREGISKLECDLNNKAHELAKEMLVRDRAYLDSKPNNVPLEVLPLDTDKIFHELEVARAILKAEQSYQNKNKINDIEDKLKQRAMELADAQKAEDIGELDFDSEDLPLALVNPHSDKQFADYVDTIRELKKDPKRNASSIENICDRMKSRAHELVQEKLMADRAFLISDPGGIQLEFLPLASDHEFRKLEAERAKLKELDSVLNASKIRDLEDLLNERAHELANEQKEEELRELRETSCGIPLCVMRLHEDAEFQALAAQRRRLKMDPSARAEDIDSLRNEMARRADELAWNTLQGDRGYLLEYPLGVSYDLLPLNTDPVLHSLEVQRAVLKAEDPHRNATQIEGLEKKLNDRAIQLGEDQMRREVAGLDEEPEGIPLALLNSYSDSDFAALVDELRDLQRKGIADGGDVASLKEAMNARAHEMAKIKKREGRGFLNPAPQGVSVDILPLDKDTVFCRMEAERVKLQAQDPHRNAREIKDLEDRLNKRFFEMAQEQICEDVKGVEEMPRGIPLEVLHPHSDSRFFQMVLGLRQLKKDPLGNANAITNLYSAMNKRVHELASEKLDRDFLKPEPLGVTLTVLPLDKDEIFHKLEAERAILKLKDPHCNAKKIKEIEDEMNERILKLAQFQLDDDVSAVDAAPGGIQLKYLKVTEDPQFAEMVIQLRSLKKNPEINADQLSDLEASMNNRAHELAKSLLEGDRDYLDRDPLGDPQGVLPLDHDGVFSQMEVERAILKAQDPILNTRKIEDLEDRLNKRVRELAEKRLEKDLQGFPTEYEGIGVSLLKPHKDTVFASMVPELRRLKEEGPREALEAHVNAMDRRLNAIVKELKGSDWDFLDQVPEGVPLIDIPLSSDKKLEELRTERGRLRAQDPLTNALKIKNCEDAMNKRAHELALEVKGDDFTGLDTKFHGIPVELLSLRGDPKSAKLIAALRSMKCQAVSPASKVEMRKIQDRLSARAHEIAKAALTEGQTRYLDNDPEGVPLNILPLDTDPKFCELQVERAQQRLADPGKNAMIIEDLENKLNERAHELAKEQLEDDVRGLDMSPCGVPMHILHPHNDAEFAAAVAKLRYLKKDSTTGEGQLKDLQGAMNSMTRRMAMCLLKGDREYLDPYLFGVPIDALPLEEDQEFHAKEVKRAILKAGDPSISAVDIALLEDELENRARQLAKEQLTEDLRGLGNPKGVPLPLLHLHDDANFTSHLPELRRLKKNPSRDGDAERTVEHKMKLRAEDIAADYLQAQRESFLSPAPLGIPLALLSLDTDQEFRTLEAERLQLMLDPKQNKDEIARLEDALNACAEKLAEQKLTIDRGYLEPEPEGIPLEFLSLGADPKFHELEVRRALLKAKDLSSNAGAIKVLEGLLNDRAHELAKERKGEELCGVDIAPRGIPIELICPHSDRVFHGMVKVLRQLKKESSSDSQKISALKADMNARAHELATKIIVSCRAGLEQLPEGIPLSSLPIDDDETFHRKEVDLAKATFANPKSSTQITALKVQLNSRARELAMALKANDLEGLDANPCGIPLYLLEPHKDAVFALAASERRANKSRGIPSEDFNRDKLNERARDLAEQLMSGDRQYLGYDPEGLLIAALSLHKDLKFCAMEAERATLKLLDPKRNAGRITDLEKRLNDRVHELVTEIIRGDRGYLEKDPEGISLEDLPLDTDMRFHIMEVERVKLKLSPMSDAHRISELEGRLNDRAHALAREQIKLDLEGVSPEPEGIPLQNLNIYQDKEFASHIFELRELKNDPERNGAKIKALQSKLNECVHKLAKVKVDADRKFLDSEPEGILLALLPLDKDKHFGAMEKKLRALEIDPGPNEAAIESLKNCLNVRAHEMAKEKIQEHRGFLNSEPGGVPLVYLPLDTDEVFHLMEVEHVKLKEDPSCNAVALSKIEADMNSRVRELAKTMKEETRKFLKASSYGIPRELLPLDTDTSFCGMERDFWKSKRGAHKVSLPENIREAMQKRADELGLEMLKGSRATYLRDNFCGMELADFPLDVDESFVDMELERALLNARDAALNGMAVADLEVKLRARAEDLVRAKVTSDRAFLDQEPKGIPLDGLDLNEDKAFLSLEKIRRELLRDPACDARKVEAVEKDMNQHVHNKATKLIAEYRSLLQPSYHGIPVERLNIQGNESFCQITKNMCRQKAGLTDPADIQMVEDEFRRASSKIIDDIIARERSFLDPEPEGMLLVDVPFECDAMFISLEAEHMQRKNDPISTHKKESVIVELENLLNDRVRALARNEFARWRAFMNQKPEGVPLEDIPLSTDPEFRAAEIARYRVLKNTPLDSVTVKQLSARMEALACKLAKDLLARERAFLDPYPEGVPLSYLPLLTDKLFCEMVRERRKLCLHPANASQVAALESSMNEHVHTLARDLVKTGRMFLDIEPLGVPIADIPLNTDEKFRKLEELRYKLSQDQSNTAALREIESQLNLRLIELAAALLAEERKFLNAAPHGILLGDLPLNNDLPLRKIERDRRALRANTEVYAEKFAMLSDLMEKRVYDIAKEELARDRHYLDPEPAGVALEYLPLDTDDSFHQMELDRRTLRHSNKNGEKDGAIAALEEKLRQRAIILAEQFVFNERAYLDRYPEGVPLQRLPLDEDREFRELELKRRRLVRNKEKNAPKIEKIERLLCDRVRVLALGHRGWQDPEFHEANKDMAELWPRILDLYPEGRNFPFEPLRMHPSDVRSAPGAAGYLAPFIAALACSPSLISQLIYTKSHPINAPYSFIFYDLHGAPVRVDVDDRVPCDANLEPKFTQVPNRSWYPLLLEKAYAKFVGGYKQMDLCTPHETLRDLTGRPVLHIPFNKKLAACTGLTGFTTTKFWMGIASALERGDVFTCMSCIDALDGIHSHTSYALLGVIQTNEKSNQSTDIVIKLHKCYHDEPVCGPLRIGDRNETKDPGGMPSFDADRTEYIYMPLPAFLRNFASMQWCNMNFSGRLTAQGEWKGVSAGGNSKFTSFRNNPIFLLENQMSRPMPVIVELRHHSPVYFDSDGVGHYYQTGLALMRAMQTHAPVTPLLTIASHKFLYRGFLLNAREVSAQMELPANTTCYLIPYTLKPGSVGRFNICVHPGMAKVRLSPLLTDCLTPSSICKKLNIKPGDSLGQRVDFQVSGACDVHILLRQERMHGVSTERGDIWGDTELRMSLHDERGIKLVSTGCATNAREHSLAFATPAAGTFSLIIHSPNSASPHKCPCTLSVYAKKHIFLRFVTVPPDARPLNQLLLPSLPSIHRSQSTQSLPVEPLARSSSRALPSIPSTHLLLMKGSVAHSIN